MKPIAIASVRRSGVRIAMIGVLVTVLWSCGSVSTLPASLAPPTAGPTPTATVAEVTPPPTASATPQPTAKVAVPRPTYFGPAAPDAAAGTTVTIVAAGDIACDPAKNVGAPADCDQAATADLIGELNPTAVLPLGDTQYEDGTPAAYASVYGPTWGKYKSITYPAIGNHEYLTKGAAGYFGYFDVPAYYSYDLGSWHMISLDSECSAGGVGGCQKGSAQEKWLLADIAAHPSQCTMAYWHEPAWSSGEHGDATQMATIWADLVATHVTVALTGHNHDYERFVPLDATGKPDPTGTTEFVVGTGGKNHYGFAVAPLTGEVVRNDKSFGVIQMTLSPTGYSWKFVAAPTYTFTDSGSAKCN